MLFKISAAICFVAVSYDTSLGASCVVRLKSPVTVCPAVTYSPEDCLDESSGKKGDIITNPAAVRIMSSGHTYYCPSHEGYIPLKDLDFSKGCLFTYVPRSSEDSPEYMGYLFVGDAAWSKKITR